jgi:chemotaxis protein methyltransferase CheR
MASSANTSIPSQGSVKQREFLFTEKDFSTLRELVGKHAGINLTDAKQELVYGRLARRLRQLGLKSFDKYCALLRSGDDQEIEIFTNAITTNLTSFFREAHHFDFLRQELLPAWLNAEENKDRSSFRIWCAGCSTGEEAYTIAMTFMEVLASQRAVTLRLLATDLDSTVLQTAARGIYDIQRVEKMESSRLEKWFMKGTGPYQGKVRVSPKLQAAICFQQHNMVHQAFPKGCAFDVVFCRNVVIYFDKLTQIEVFNRFADCLAPGGHLFVGHSESLFQKSDRFKLVSQSTYQRCR